MCSLSCWPSYVLMTSESLPAKRRRHCRSTILCMWGVRWSALYWMLRSMTFPVKPQCETRGWMKRYCQMALGCNNLHSRGAILILQLQSCSCTAAKTHALHVFSSACVQANAKIQCPVLYTSTKDFQVKAECEFDAQQTQLIANLGWTKSCF